MIMKIVVKNAGEKPVVKEIKGELNEMQEIVGGYIEAFHVMDDILCVCNEEGKLIGLQPNFVLMNDVVVGNVFFVSAGEEDFESLNNEQIALLLRLFGFLV